METRFERRPVRPSTSAYVADLLRGAIDLEHARELGSQILEDYSVEKDRVYVRDNEKNAVAELVFKNGLDLFCNLDSSNSCLHVGYALSIPAVQLIIHERRKGSNNYKK